MKMLLAKLLREETRERAPGAEREQRWQEQVRPRGNDVTGGLFSPPTIRASPAAADEPHYANDGCNRSAQARVESKA